MHASNRETIYSAGSGDWTQARLMTVSGSARTVPMSHRDKVKIYWELEQNAMNCEWFQSDHLILWVAVVCSRAVADVPKRRRTCQGLRSLDRQSASRRRFSRADFRRRFLDCVSWPWGFVKWIRLKSPSRPVFMFCFWLKLRDLVEAELVLSMCVYVCSGGTRPSQRLM